MIKNNNDNKIKNSINNNFILILASALIYKKIYVFINFDKNLLIKKYLSMLTLKEREIYYKIKNERFYIYIKGYILGVIISTLILYYYQKNINYKINWALGILISNYITYTFYILYPKSDYMIRYLDTQEERSVWLKIYRNLMINSHFGLLLGFIASILINKMFV